MTVMSCQIAATEALLRAQSKKPRVPRASTLGTWLAKRGTLGALGSLSRLRSARRVYAPVCVEPRSVLDTLQARGPTPASDSVALNELNTALPQGGPVLVAQGTRTGTDAVRHSSEESPPSGRRYPRYVGCKLMVHTISAVQCRVGCLPCCSTPCQAVAAVTATLPATGLVGRGNGK